MSKPFDAIVIGSGQAGPSLAVRPASAGMQAVRARKDEIVSNSLASLTRWLSDTGNHPPSHAHGRVPDLRTACIDRKTGMTNSDAAVQGGCKSHAGLPVSGWGGK
jgi:thioredoxin reductase